MVLMDVSANLDQSDDIALAGAAAPASIPAGGGAEYAFVVSSGGPGSAPVTFTEPVPAGLRILSAAAGTGTCSTTGQTVTCTIPGLASGSTAPVRVIVSAASGGSYPDTAAVATPLTDPTPANNSASATLTVAAVAKVVIPALHCKVGQTTKRASKRFRKGNVIFTSPGSGTHAAGTKVDIVVSSGPAPKKKQQNKQ